jgi:hypothetical protein
MAIFISFYYRCLPLGRLQRGGCDRPDMLKKWRKEINTITKLEEKQTFWDVTLDKIWH